MEPIKIQRIVEGPMLVTRASARKLQPSLDDVASEDARISLDFDGIAGMTPSFFDELLRAIDEISHHPQEQPTIIIHNPLPKPPRNSKQSRGATAGRSMSRRREIGSLPPSMGRHRRNEPHVVYPASVRSMALMNLTYSHGS